MPHKHICLMDAAAGMILEKKGGEEWSVSCRWRVCVCQQHIYNILGISLHVFLLHKSMISTRDLFFFKYLTIFKNNQMDFYHLRDGLALG